LEKPVKILFITTTNLASNPRLLKELNIAQSSGFDCTVIQFCLGNWSDLKTEDLINDFPNVKFVFLSALRKPFTDWAISSLLELFLKRIPARFLSLCLLAYASGKRSYLLHKYLKKSKDQHDWIIAHNPAAFFPAYWLSNKSETRLGIDVEDYHPGETGSKENGLKLIRLMRTVLNHAAYISFSSPLIKNETLAQICSPVCDQFIILNGFNGADFTKPMNQISGNLKLIWFSQYIDAGRGLEEILPALEHIKTIELHLIGELRNSFHDTYLREKEFIFLHGTMTPSELNAAMVHFDIGLALEPGKDLNNNLAVSNKIITYAQAGLYILASHTPAQDQFLRESNLDYTQTDLSEKSLIDILLELQEKKELIRAERLKRYEQGRCYDWEKSGDILYKRWMKN
jgi:hypothetical protein